MTIVFAIEYAFCYRHIITIRVVRAEIGIGDTLTILDGDTTTTIAELFDRRNTHEKLFHEVFNSTG